MKLAFSVAHICAGFIDLLECASTGEKKTLCVCLSTSLRCGYGNSREGSGQNILPCVSNSPRLEESSRVACWLLPSDIYGAAEESGFCAANAQTVIASPLLLASFSGNTKLQRQTELSRASII